MTSSANWTLNTSRRRLAACLPRPFFYPVAAVLGLVVLVACAPAPRDGRGANTKTMGENNATLIRGALLVDGTGAPGEVGDLRIAAGLIEEIARGERLQPRSGERTVDARGLVLAPGFIDTHSHHDAGLAQDPGAREAVSQGITTVVVGNDGGSRLPLADWFTALERAPVAVNVASFSGHNTLRAKVLGEDAARPASDSEIEEMAALLRADLAAGALGLSTGLEYEPGLYSKTEEVVTLATVASRSGGRYISHLRSEDRELLAAVDEILYIGREARIPVQISHFKLAKQSLWGTADDFLAKLDRARAEGIEVTADVYPYTFWQSTMTVLFPDRHFTEEAARFALDELAPPEGMWLAAFAPQPDLVGRSLRDIADQRNLEAWEVYLALIAEAQEWATKHPDHGGPSESIIATSMVEADIETLLRWPHTNICSDGALGGRHPRGIGTYPRILGRYVRERGVLTLEAAIHKSTELAARNVGLADLEPARGRLAAGAAADLVLFDPRIIRDQATPEEPLRPNVGIHAVWVNGELVYDNGAVTGNTPGHVLRRPR